MGECIIARSGTGSGGGNIIETVSAPPILNASNPTSSELYLKNNRSISLSVFVEENNVNCTYQWFINNSVILGANNSIFEYTPEDTYAVNTIKCAVTNKAGTTYSREATITVWPTRLYIIKDSKIVDPTAAITSKSSNVSVSGTAVSLSTNGSNTYATLTSNLLKNYNNAVCATYTTNNNYNERYTFEIMTLNEDFVDINTSGKKYTITSPLDFIAILISTKTNNYVAKITINEFYVE